MAKVLVFIDNPGQALKKASLELLTIARSLGEPAVAFNGELHDDVAAALAAYGAKRCTGPPRRTSTTTSWAPRRPILPPRCRPRKPRSS